MYVLGEPCREHSPLVAHSYVYRCFEKLLTSCLNGSFLECSPLTAEAWVWFPAWTCQSWDLWFKMKMTFVKSLQAQFFQEQKDRRMEEYHCCITVGNVPTHPKKTGRWNCLLCWHCCYNDIVIVEFTSPLLKAPSKHNSCTGWLYPETEIYLSPHHHRFSRSCYLSLKPLINPLPKQQISIHCKKAHQIGCSKCKAIWLFGETRTKLAIPFITSDPLTFSRPNPTAEIQWLSLSPVLSHPLHLNKPGQTKQHTFSGCVFPHSSHTRWFSAGQTQPQLLAAFIFLAIP